MKLSKWHNFKFSIELSMLFFFAYPRYTKNMLDEKNFTIVDVETTGGSPFFSRIIEIGLLKIEKGEVVEEYQTLINPGVPIPEFISNMTGITNKDVSNKPTFLDIAEELLQKFEDSIFVAHNAGFDYGFIKEEFRRAGFVFNQDRLCTVRLSRALYKEHKRHNLSAIIERYEFECKNRHRAFDDAKVLWDFLLLSKSQHAPEVFNAALKNVTTKSRSAKPKIIVDEIVYEPEAGETLTIG